MILRKVWWFLKEKMWCFIKKHFWIILCVILFGIFLIPFVKIYRGTDPDDMCMFGLDSLKDFFTLWISLFGVVGLAINIIHSQIRIRLQDKLIHQQEKQGRDNRFAKSVELLGHNSESARMGGAYNLRFLAKEFFNEYGDCMFSILSSHIRVITSAQDYLNRFKEKPSDEIQSILDTLAEGSFKIDLTNSYLERANLEGANLGRANLEGANLRRADLANACLVEAYLIEAYLEGANLKGANLKGANLTGTNLANACLEEARLEEANLTCANLQRANLQGVNLKRAYLKRAYLEGANLEGADLANACLVEAYLIEAYLKGANLTGANLEGANLEEVNLWGADLRKTNFKGAILRKVFITEEQRELIKAAGGIFQD